VAVLCSASGNVSGVDLQTAGVGSRDRAYQHAGGSRRFGKKTIQDKHIFLFSIQSVCKFAKGTLKYGE